MDLSLFLMKVSQFDADSPEAFAKYLSGKVMHKLENKIQHMQKLKELEAQIASGEFDDTLDPDSLFLKSKGEK